MAIVLTPGVSAQASSDIVVSNSNGLPICIYTDDGSEIPYGVILYLQRRTPTGAYADVSTAGYGKIVLTQQCNVFAISIPGVYKVFRPDISEFGVNIGVDAG